jgi:hypothetical protein
MLDLSGADMPLKAIAIDTKKKYAEIDLGNLSSGKQNMALPYHSDWAVCVGVDEE